VIKISHRGNISGPNERHENSPPYIIEALEEGYDVEVDVWLLDGELFLGHDIPEYNIHLNFLKNNKFWCHCKNIDALKFLLYNDVRCFYHDKDEATLTSDGYIWTYPGKKLTNKSICVMPEWNDWKIEANVHGICTDYVQKIEEYIK